MDVIMIHGSPAVGKFTVAKELSTITNYKLIHIHSIYDFLEDIFSRDNYPIILRIINKTYLSILEEAVTSDIKGIIFTYTSVSNNNFEFVKRVKLLNNCKFRAVQLTCDENELFKRVLDKSRKEYCKTKSIEELKYILSNCDLSSTFSGIETIKINNTHLSPKEVAKLIKENFLI